MSEMTLEQAIAKLDSKLCTASEYATAWPIVKAHLTRAPVQVTDDAIEELGEFVAKHLGHKHWETFSRMRKSLSARLAQPVVAELDTMTRAKIMGVLSHAEAMELQKDKGCDFANAGSLLREYAALLSQPHPQAAQGELSGNSEELPAYARCGCAECVNLRGGKRDELAERAAVPEGWQSIETAPTDGTLHVRGTWVNTPRGSYFDAIVGGINDEGEFVDLDGDSTRWDASDYTHWHPLSAAPTLAGKEKG